MNFRVHVDSPADAVEEAFFRIQREQMADVPILNPALAVEAIDFQRWQGHWLGIVVTPWCMSMLLVPGGGENWVSTGENRRRFVRFPAGDFAFLGSEEAELGEYQSCPLFSPMGKFATQSEATMTARASLIALLTTPQAVKDAGKSEKSDGEPSLSRRRFLALR
ncbi:MAG: [NiFe]-hydrogenase assembly chaperone HybE [Rhodocyclales bacterium]|jgi:[NiFe] hydrogenase assembly HybE family chaperone|nr:[NiFe]-hydrogenase assembly chaperone HybE [Rhodocyclales bacterium]